MYAFVFDLFRFCRFREISSIHVFILKVTFFLGAALQSKNCLPITEAGGNPGIYFAELNFYCNFTKKKK